MLTYTVTSTLKVDRHVDQFIVLLAVRAVISDCWRHSTLPYNVMLSFAGSYFADTKKDQHNALFVRLLDETYDPFSVTNLMSPRLPAKLDKRAFDMRSTASSEVCSVLALWWLPKQLPVKLANGLLSFSLFVYFASIMLIVMLGVLKRFGFGYYVIRVCVRDRCYRKLGLPAT